MKKIIVFSLITALVLSAIYVSVFATRTAVSNEDVLLHVCEDGSYIKITWCHKKESWFEYTTALVFEAGQTQLDGTINTKSYSIEAKSFSEKLLTIGELCKRNDMLREADAFSKIQNLYYAKLLLADSHEDFLKLIENTVLHDYCDEVQNLKEDACEELIIEAAKPIFGFETPIKDFIGKCNETMEKGNLLSEMSQKIGFMLRDFAIIEIERIGRDEGELEKQYRAIRDENATGLIDLIMDIGSNNIEQ